MSPRSIHLFESTSSKSAGSDPSAFRTRTAGNLDRLQIVKGWTKNGQSFEKIYDVIWCDDRRLDPVTGKLPPIRSTVDIANATYTNSIGDVELKRVWTDPDFDPSLHAFYYARALEIPTPRWTTIQAHQLGIAPPDVVPATVQERAWSSPIWYTPTSEARQAVPQGLTVAGLKQKGGVALDENKLKQMLFGKSVWVRNNVTGEQFKLRCRTDGQCVILHVGKDDTLPSEVGDPAVSGYQVAPSQYSIQDGKLVAMLGGAPFALALYKMGDTYYGARSNEFGYANYQVLPKGPRFYHPLGKGEKDDLNQAEYLHVPEKK